MMEGYISLASHISLEEVWELALMLSHFEGELSIDYDNFKGVDNVIDALIGGSLTVSSKRMREKTK